jgi:hypothetical protein
LNGGISPGHWLSLFRSTSDELRIFSDCTFSRDFTRLWFRGRGAKRSKFSQMSELELVNKLNDFKHHRGPSGASACEQASEVHRLLLDEMLLMIESVSQWDFFICDDLDFLPSENIFECRVRLLKGDHPCFETSRKLFSIPIAKGGVYVTNGDEVISLSPFIVERFNNVLGKNELFSLDKKSREGAYILKSFETGSSIEADEELTEKLNEELNVTCLM